MRTVVAAVFALAMVSASAHPGSGIAVDARGRVIFVDTGGGVFRIEGGGALTRLPGPAFHWFALDATGAFTGTRLPSTPDAEMRSEGSDPPLVLSSDYPVAISGGALFYADPGPDRRLKLVRVAPDGSRTVHATLPPHLAWLHGIAPAPDGSLLYTEAAAVRRVARDGTISTVVEGVTVPGCTRPPGYEASGTPDLRGLSVSPDGTVHVAASGCSALLRVSPKGQVSILLRAESPWTPTAVAVSGGDLYVLEYLLTPGDDRRQWLPRVRRLAKGGTVTELARVRGR